jgi:hypothetical protein
MIIDTHDELSNMLRSEDSLASFDFIFNNYTSITIEPEKQVMIEILVRAIIDYLAPTRQAFFDDADEWFFRPDIDETEYMYSFENIALTLNMNVSSMRRRLQQRKTEKGDFILEGKRVNII